MTDSETSASFEELVAHAMARPVRGWDFSVVGDRIQEEGVPWDYAALVRQRMKDAQSVIDLGTGGGEFLAGIGSYPECTVATECFAPNVGVAAARLHALGVSVVAAEEALDNYFWRAPGAEGARGTPRPGLPFKDRAFDLVINRHEAYAPDDVLRVLRPGGTFLTQQVGGGDDAEFRLMVGAPIGQMYAWGAYEAEEQLVEAGFNVVVAREHAPVTRFADLGALVFYLRMVPWTVPDFEVTRYRDRLRDLHERMGRNGPLEVPGLRFLVEARRPDA